MNDALVRYAEELLRWNERINLTAASSLDDAMQHILDCEHLIEHIPADTKSLVDVGSGGGLPAAVIAILRPEIEVTAIEPTHKKVAFLQQVRRLFAPNLVPLAIRVEQYTRHDHDVATSRATFAIDRWLELGRSLVHPGGRVLGMEGADEMTLPPFATRHRYAHGDRTRAIVVLEVPRGDQ